MKRYTSDNLWKKYLEEISRLQRKGDISSDDYYLLRASLQARTELMNVTMGDEDVFIEGTPQEILKRITLRIKAEELAKVNTERIMREKVEVELRESQLREEAKEQARQKQFNLINLKIETTAGKLAHWLSITAFVILAIMLLFGAYATFPGSLQNISSNFWSYILPGALTVFLLLSLLNIIFGTTVRGYSRHLELLIMRFIESKLKNWLLH